MKFDEIEFLLQFVEILLKEFFAVDFNVLFHLFQEDLNVLLML